MIEIMTILDEFKKSAHKRDHITIHMKTKLTLIKPIIINRDPEILTIFDEHHKTLANILIRQSRCLLETCGAVVCASLTANKSHNK